MGHSVRPHRQLVSTGSPLTGDIRGIKEFSSLLRKKCDKNDYLRETHTRGHVHTDTHIRSRCFPLFAAALYDKKRKMLLLSNYERLRCDKWLWIGWLVSATQPESVLPYVANDLCKVKKCLSKVLNNNTKNCARYFPLVTVTTLIAPPL